MSNTTYHVHNNTPLLKDAHRQIIHTYTENFFSSVNCYSQNYTHYMYTHAHIHKDIYDTAGLSMVMRRSALCACQGCLFTEPVFDVLVNISPSCERTIIEGISCPFYITSS